MATEQDFTKKAIENAQIAMLAHGAATKRLLRDLETYGGVRLLQDLCRKHRLSDGFDELAACGHTELTLEALAVQSRFGALFTDEEVNRCCEALCQTDHFLKNR